MSDEELARSAEWIASARVGASRTQWSDGELWTLLELQVSHTAKGPADRAVTLALPGGLDVERGLSSVVPGVTIPPLAARVLVFGRRSPHFAGAFELLSLLQGMVIEPAAAPDPAQVAIPSDPAALRVPQPARARVDVALERVKQILAGAQPAQGQAR